MTDINKAIKALRPNSSFGVSGDRIKWNDPDNKQPTETEINDKIVELKAEYDALAWQRSREAEYPSVQECVHAILDDQLDALQAKRAEIKTKYPKG
tara:strand:+ start:176 stop:463 length:288 start_codon:yes stop_codon:yes gene_type:complete